jgi:DMSO/TMAO reductase YedYZ molybdopterin-dependent catalytic subunit
MSTGKTQSVHMTEAESRQLSRRMTRRSFTVGGLAALGGLGSWYWLLTRSPEGELPWPLRRVLEFNENLARPYFHSGRLAPTFSREQAREPRVNGPIGLSQDFDPARWKLNIEIPGHRGAAREFSLAQIKALPRVEMVTELKCIEGWSDPVNWAGARLSDFVAKYGFGTRSGNPPDPEHRKDDLLKYVYLETPDQEYYVGLDMESAIHSQTLLCYEMNGAPLTLDHGGPLRLVIPLKYGIKNIKRIGTIRFTDQRPKDYWAERGYDWYAGH